MNSVETNPWASLLRKPADISSPCPIPFDKDSILPAGDSRFFNLHACVTAIERGRHKDQRRTNAGCSKLGMDLAIVEFSLAMQVELYGLTLKIYLAQISTQFQVMILPENSMLNSKRCDLLANNLQYR